MEPITVSYHPRKFSWYRQSGSRDIIVFVRHVTLPDHVIKVLYDFMVGNPSKLVTTVQVLVALGTVAVEIQWF